jgi:recombination protein RecA
MTAAPLSHSLARLDALEGVAMARDLLSVPSSLETAWNLDALAGRFVELTGGATSAALTMTVSLVLEAQRRGEAAAWILSPDSSFYPPDLGASGMDLNALPVVRAGKGRDAARAAEVLLRSESFSLVVIDTGHLSRFSLSIQMRLARLAAAANAVLLCISEESNERGSLVSFRGQAAKTKTGHDCFECELRALKDKRSHPGWVHRELYGGADGLC